MDQPDVRSGYLPAQKHILKEKHKLKYTKELVGFGNGFGHAVDAEIYIDTCGSVEGATFDLSPVLILIPRNGVILHTIPVTN